MGPRRRRARAHVQDEGEQHRPGRHQDDRRRGAKAENDFRALVIANQGEHFCVGANLFLVVMAAGQKQWDQIRADGAAATRTRLQRMKYASVPVVAAPYGMTLGGGLELCFGATQRAGGGRDVLGPRRGGRGARAGRRRHDEHALARARRRCPKGRTVEHVRSTSRRCSRTSRWRRSRRAPRRRRRFGYFRSTDGVSFDRARLLTEAKARAIGLAEAGWHPPAPRAYVLPGESGIATLSMMVDTLVGRAGTPASTTRRSRGSSRGALRRRRAAARTR